MGERSDQQMSRDRSLNVSGKQHLEPDRKCYVQHKRLVGAKDIHRSYFYLETGNDHSGGKECHVEKKIHN